MSWRRTALPPFQIKSSRPERCLFKANRYVTGDIISRHETLTTSALVHEHFRRQSVSRVACFRPYTAASGERMRNLLRRRVAGRIFADFTGSGSKKKPISYATSSVLPSDMWYRRTGAPRPKLTITHSWYRCYNILHTDVLRKLAHIFKSLFKSSDSRKWLVTRRPTSRSVSLWA